VNESAVAGDCMRGTDASAAPPESGRCGSNEATESNRGTGSQVRNERGSVQTVGAWRVFSLASCTSVEDAYAQRCRFWEV